MGGFSSRLAGTRHVHAGPLFSSRTRFRVPVCKEGPREGKENQDGTARRLKAVIFSWRAPRSCADCIRVFRTMRMIQDGAVDSATLERCRAYLCTLARLQFPRGFQG